MVKITPSRSAPIRIVAPDERSFSTTPSAGIPSSAAHFPIRPWMIWFAYHCRTIHIMRILIADDDPVARCRLEDCLQEWGYQVVAAADGAEAIQLLQAPDAPQLALLDWMMPGLDGQQVCWEMRRGGRDRYVYLILVTAKARTDEIVAAF